MSYFKFDIGDWVFPANQSEADTLSFYGLKWPAPICEIAADPFRGHRARMVNGSCLRMEELRAAHESEMWSDWIEWRGGRCPIPWAGVAQWGSEATGSPRVYKEGIPAAAVSNDWWSHQSAAEPALIKCTAYRFRLDCGPFDFEAPNGSFTDEYGDTHFYRLEKNAAGLTLTVLTERLLTQKHLEIAYTVDENINAVVFPHGFIRKNMAFQGRTRVTKDDAIIEDQRTSITLRPDALEPAVCGDVFNAHQDIGIAHDASTGDEPEPAPDLDVFDPLNVFDRLTNDARHFIKKGELERVLVLLDGLKVYLEDAIRPDKGLTEKLADKAEEPQLDEVTADAEYWKGRAELYEQKLDAIRRIVAPEGDRL